MSFYQRPCLLLTYSSSLMFSLNRSFALVLTSLERKHLLISFFIYHAVYLLFGLLFCCRWLSFLWIWLRIGDSGLLFSFHPFLCFWLHFVRLSRHHSRRKSGLWLLYSSDLMATRSKDIFWRNAEPPSIHHNPSAPTANYICELSSRY